MFTRWQKQIRHLLTSLGKNKKIHYNSGFFYGIFCFILCCDILTAVTLRRYYLTLNKVFKKNMIDSKEYLEFIVKGIVDHPEDVKVDKKIDEMGVLLTLTVHKEDMGQVIGKQGSTAKAMRTLVRVNGMKSNARVNVKINEPGEGEESPSFEE